MLDKFRRLNYVLLKYIYFAFISIRIIRPFYDS